MQVGSRSTLGRGWSPVLRGDDAARARESATRVAEQLADLTAPSFDLAAGGAGIALALFYLSEALGRMDLQEAAQVHWSRSLTQLSSAFVSPGLYSGFSGPAWVTAHLPDKLFDDADDSVHDEIDSTLLQHLQMTQRYDNYDLIGGLAGYGIYALERWPHGLSGDILAAIVKHVVLTSDRSSDGVRWMTQPETLPAHQLKTAPNGYWNMGLAHGIPGIVVLLARVQRAGVLSADGREALEGGVAWLLANRQRMKNGLCFPGWIPVGVEVDFDDHQQRPTWCYGDLGVAAALFVAGESTGRSDWSKAALDVALACTRVPFEESGVRDTGLCHGAGGIAHLFCRMAAATQDPALASAARSWLHRTLAMRRSSPEMDGYVSWEVRNPGASRLEDFEFDYIPQPGFLTGAAGVALALAAGFADIEPAWDRALGVSS